MIHHSERSTRQCVHCTTSSFLKNIVVIMVEMVNVVVVVALQPCEVAKGNSEAGNCEYVIH